MAATPGAVKCEGDQSTLHARKITVLPSVTIRFAGDSGDGMQLAGTQFTDTSALAGNDLATFPDYPSEIRAPAGTVAGVSGYQIHLANEEVFTTGDAIDALIAMNAAALKVNLRSVKSGGLIIVNEDAFAPNDLRKAGYESNPLEDGSLRNHRLVRVPMDAMNAAATKDAGLNPRDTDRCKNMFALGLVYWLYGRSMDATIDYINKKFSKKPAVAKANLLTLKAGYHYGETCELFEEQYQVPRAKLAPGTYRKMTGNEAMALGLIAAARMAGQDLVYCSYPITPATDILHELSGQKHMGVITFQAEDEIAAMGAAIGASFGGAISATATSGPGIALKSEAIGLAVMTELPVVIVNVQRGGPSTGLPTKTEQSDLFQAILGRHGECPIPVIAASTSTDCFEAAIEATTIAVKYMTPVMVLSDGYLANGSEPWLVPDASRLGKIVVQHPTADGKPYRPYLRDENGARPWAIPGTPGLEHRIGGLEKQDITGQVSYDALNHEKMVKLRAQKIANVKPVGASYLWTGPEKGDVLIVGWGSTYGAIKEAVLALRAQGVAVSHCHIRYVNPLSERIGPLLKAFTHVLVPEMNLGQLSMLLRARFLVDAKSVSKVRGQPFTVQEIEDAVRAAIAGG